MKKILCALLVWCAFHALAPKAAEAGVSVSLTYFHETLAPHGRWVTARAYGDVFVPRVAAGWEPYVDGEWVYTDWGWTWVSGEPWADVAFHYGTWTWVEPYGWVWVPGLVWAPAWVTWAYTDDCVGWAPVPVSFVLSGSGYFGRPIVVSRSRYVFVPARQFVGTRVSRVRFPAGRNAALLSRATKVTRYEVSRGVVRNVGPRPERLERAVGHRIERVSAERARVRPVAAASAGSSRRARLAVVAPERSRAKSAAVKPSRETRRATQRREVRSAPKASGAAASVRRRDVRPAKPSRAVGSRERRTVHAAPPAARRVERAQKPRPAVRPAPRPQRRQPAVAPARSSRNPHRAAPPAPRRPASPAKPTNTKPDRGHAAADDHQKGGNG